jgi:peptidoglycan hydrolase-like protein with peptidoglycan-binding domain
MTLEEKQQTVPESQMRSGLALRTGFRHRIRVDNQLTAHVLELEDVFFHHNSAVLLPDFGMREENSGEGDGTPITGLSVLASCLRQAEDNPDRKLLIAGHTDTSGEEDYNVELSELRAENVRAALEGERRAWVGGAQEKGKVEDYQQILNWVNSVKGYLCDCGPVDDDHGIRTARAVRAFQRAYNQEYYPDGGTWNADTGGPIEVDGVVGEQTWGAFFDIYQERLAAILETDVPGLDTPRGSLNWLDEEQKGVGCGESHPIEAPRRDDYRSRRNRRVELLWFAEDEVPEMSCHSGDACDPESCRVYDPDLYRYVHVDGGPSGEERTRRLILQILAFDPDSDEEWEEDHIGDVSDIEKPCAADIPGESHEETEEGDGETPAHPRSPRADLPYSIVIKDSTEVEGTTDEDGWIRATIPSGAREARLTLDPGGPGEKEILVKIGDFSPSGEVSGVQQRLNNLGFPCGDPDGSLGTPTRAALRKFQRYAGLAVTGESDQPTRDALEKHHGF